MSFVEIALTWLYWTVGLVLFSLLLMMWTNNAALELFSWILLAITSFLSIFSIGFLAVTKYNNPQINTTKLVFALFLFRFLFLLFFIGLYIIGNRSELGNACLIPILLYFTIYTFFDTRYLSKYSDYLDRKFK